MANVPWQTGEITESFGQRQDKSAIPVAGMAQDCFQFKIGTFGSIQRLQLTRRGAAIATFA